MKTSIKAAIAATSIVMTSFAYAQSVETFIPEDWSVSDTIRQTAVVASLAADMAQTLDIKRHEGLYETNKILGRHPSDAKVVLYFVGVALAHTYIATKLPAGWQRQTFQYGLIAVQVVQVMKNKRIGLSVKF